MSYTPFEFFVLHPQSGKKFSAMRKEDLDQYSEWSKLTREGFLRIYRVVPDDYLVADDDKEEALRNLIATKGKSAR